MDDRITIATRDIKFNGEPLIVSGEEVRVVNPNAGRITPHDKIYGYRGRYVTISYRGMERTICSKWLARHRLQS